MLPLTEVARFTSFLRSFNHGNTATPKLSRLTHTHTINMSQLVIWICLYIFQHFFGQYHPSLVKILKQIPLKYTKAASIVLFSKLNSAIIHINLVAKHVKEGNMAPFISFSPKSNPFLDLNHVVFGVPFPNTIPYKVGPLPVTSRLN